MSDALKHPSSFSNNSCYRIDAMGKEVTQYFQTSLPTDPLENTLVHGNQADQEAAKIREQISYLDEKTEIPKDHPLGMEKAEKLVDSHLESAVKEEPKLELEPLPSSLQYVFLEEDSKLPVIIAAGLNDEQKKKLMAVLRKHKEAIAWKLFDIKGISPSYCTHKILMEEGYKPVVQPQRRLNPNMKDVVKAEVIKLLDASLIYPISDSS